VAPAQLKPESKEEFVLLWLQMVLLGAVNLGK
jgi:hypothetical protein